MIVALGAGCNPGTDPTCGGGGDLAGAGSMLKWLAFAVAAWILYTTLQRARR